MSGPAPAGRARPTRRRLAAMALAYTVAVVGALGALAVFAERHPARLDLTANRRHTLAPETLALLRSIPEDGAPVEVLAVLSFVASGGDERAVQEAASQVQPLLALLGKASRQVRTRVVFAEQEPQLVASLELLSVPSLVLRWQPPAAGPADGGAPPGPPPARIRRTDVMTEAGFRQALKELLEGAPRIAYVLAGHGEGRLADPGPNGFSGLAQVLGVDNFELRELFLAGSGSIPDDAALVLVAGPTTDLAEQEIEALRGHARRGGRLLVMAGPSLQPDALSRLVAYLASDWAVVLGKGVVADLDAPLQGNQVVLLVRPAEQAQHPIVRGFGRMIQVPIARPCASAPDYPVGVGTQVLLGSGPRSWVEEDVQQERPSYEDGVDARGPHPLAVAATSQPTTGDPQARLVVVGSRHVFENMFLPQAGNAAFLRNCTAWLTGREEEIEARRGSGEDGTVVIPVAQGTVVLASVFAIPAIVALAGVAVWWIRRSL